MKSILCKALTKKNTEWIIGCVYYKQSRPKPFAKDNNVKYYIVDCNNRTYEIEKSTICKMVGCVDKYAHMIWEHDILKHDNVLWEVYYDEGNYEWGIKNKNESIGIGYVPIYEYERVGNIFDNPELSDLI